jgi:prephenate dehydratase
VITSKDRRRVAFQGEPGAFSEEAALKLLGTEIDTVPRRTFADLFHSLDEGVADYILAPVENTISGVVRPSVDLLEGSRLTLIGEVSIPIAQHLIGCPGARFVDVQVVQSHPVALAQCSRFFAEHPQLKAVEADDTAGSVADVVRLGLQSRAAIAGKRAAEIYGAVIIRESIQDRRDNVTRFVLLSPSAVTTLGMQS